MTGFYVHNPATGSTENSREFATDAEILSQLALAASANTEWAQLPLSDRAKRLTEFASGLRGAADELAEILAREVGKPLDQGLFEVDLSASIFDYYCDRAADFLSPNEISVPGAGRVVVEHHPIGALLGVMPWNFPLYQVARVAAPNLLLGNAVVIKPAPQCLESSEFIRLLAEKCELGDVLQILYAAVPQIASVVESPHVRGVTLTGSDAAGRSIAELAGRNLKKVVLELGGSDPFVVLADADVESAVAEAAFGRFFNCGQACNSAKRIIVEAPLYDQFVEAFSERVAALKVGDPRVAGTEIGPVSSGAALQTLQNQLRDAQYKGARLVVGGQVDDQQPGYWIRPAVVTGVTREMDMYRQEVFGPIGVVYRANDEAEAIQLANDTEYGLGASVHSGDVDHALSVGAQIHSGMLFINEATATTPEMPFGGIGRSGFGRELGVYALREFANERLVRIR